MRHQHFVSSHLFILSARYRAEGEINEILLSIGVGQFKNGLRAHLEKYY